MQVNYPSFSTDQVASLVELARCGSLRRAGESLHLSEQGVRNRLIALERVLGVELYRKQRGVRRSSPLTADGRRFLPHAQQLLDRSRELRELFDDGEAQREVRVAASQYLIQYLLIDVIRRFHIAFPSNRIRLETRSEQEIEQELQAETGIELGIAAPLEPSPDLDYRHLFSLEWSLVTPRDHPLMKRRKLELADLADQPLIFFERGSTGRQHVVDAFHRAGLSPRVEMETTSTQVIVQMVEAGLGISIVPLLPGGIVTRGRRVAARGLRDRIRRIDSGILLRRGEAPSAAAAAFIGFVEGRCRGRFTQRNRRGG